VRSVLAHVPWRCRRSAPEQQKTKMAPVRASRERWRHAARTNAPSPTPEKLPRLQPHPPARLTSPWLQRPVTNCQALVHVQKPGADTWAAAPELLACQVDFLSVLSDYTTRGGAGDTVSRPPEPARTASQNPPYMPHLS
jgi:hypothetical protein